MTSEEVALELKRLAEQLVAAGLTDRALQSIGGEAKKISLPRDLVVWE